jgi:hypothetical protein
MPLKRIAINLTLFLEKIPAGLWDVHAKIL